MRKAQKYVIILEDDEDIADLFAQLLSSYGAAPITCRTAEAVQEAIERHPVALALLDIMLPDTDGRNVAAMLYEKKVDFPVYFMTGVSPQNIGAEYLKKASGILRKPFSIQELRQVLDKSLKSSDKRRESTAGRQMLELMTAIATERENIRRQQCKLIGLLGSLEIELGHKDNSLAEQFREFAMGLEAGMSRFAAQLDAVKSLLEPQQ